MSDDITPLTPLDAPALPKPPAIGEITATVEPAVELHPYRDYVYAAYGVMALAMLWLLWRAYRERGLLRARQSRQADATSTERRRP